MSVRDADVLIVGGGIVGPSAAVFLSAQGVPVQLVERRPSALAHPRGRGIYPTPLRPPPPRGGGARALAPPRARVINPRTVELYRQVGLEPAIQAARSRAKYSSGLVIRADTLTAPERAVTEMQASPDPSRDGNVSTA